MEVCACKETLGGNFGGYRGLFVYACSKQWAWFIWLVVYYVWGVKESTVVMRDCVEYLVGLWID